MLNQYSREEFVFGEDAIKTLRQKRVAVFGIGGVGGNVVEALARSGVGDIDVIDDDRICLTNLNRQILATRKTVAKFKVDAAEARVHDIDPDIRVHKHRRFYLPEKNEKEYEQSRPDIIPGADDLTEDEPIDFTKWDYVVDAIDTVTGKLGIIMEAKRLKIPVISCMGCGNRTDPTKLTVCDIYETRMDPLARVMRRELRKRKVKSLKVIYSTEPAIRPVTTDNSCLTHCICPPGTTRKCTERRDIPGSTAFVPPAAGLIAASVVVRDLISFDPSDRIKGGRG